VACGHLFGNVPIKEGVERHIIGTGIFRTFIQLEELSLYLLPDCLLSLVDRPVKVLASQNSIPVLLHVIPELPREAVCPFHPPDGTLLILVPTHLHSPTPDPSLESSLPYHGLLWVEHFSEILVSD